jgi:hypothetical protein
MATPTAGGILRIGSYAGIAGALLGLVGNLLHPATPIGDPEAVARTIADSQLWVPDHLAIVLGLILMLGGLIAIAHSIQDGLPAALARLGSIAAVAGITVGLILVTLDGLAAKGIAEAWATAPVADQAAALQLVAAEETINFALAALFNIPFRRRHLHPLRPGCGLEPDLPSLAGMDRGPRRRRFGRRRPDPGRRRRAHHRDQGPHHHLPHRDHPVVGGDEPPGPPQGTRAGTRYHSC